MTSPVDELVEWRFAASDAELADWERRPDMVSIAIDYRLPDAPAGEWWRVHVVTHAWLHGMLSLPYTARAFPTMLIVPDGSLAERSAAVSRMLGRGPALDLTRVAERVAERVVMPVPAAGADHRFDPPA